MMNLLGLKEFQKQFEIREKTYSFGWQPCNQFTGLPKNFAEGSEKVSEKVNEKR